MIAVPLRPICEPVELPRGISVIAERVLVKAGTSDVGDFMHFHDVAELVLFRKVRGSFIARGQKHEIGDGAVVFVPSMEQHDFLLDGRAMEWVLIQFDPDLLDTVAVRSAKLGQPLCLLPDEQTKARIDALADWLVELAPQTDAKVERIAELLLLAVADLVEKGTPAPSQTSPVQRLLPAVELLRRAPGEHVALETAATLCRVSPAYFSRRFRQLFGMTYTNYARTYRLRLAARRLIAGGASISEIAYGVGFSSPAHFSARFRERFGMTPREYRASAALRAG
jgi:AraC-like DNA-binding protein